MNFISIKSSLEELDDAELHRWLSIVNLKLRKNKDIMKNDEGVIKAQDNLNKAKNKYKLESMKLKTAGEQLVKELVLRNFDSCFLEEEEA